MQYFRFRGCFLRLFQLQELFSCKTFYFRLVETLKKSLDFIFLRTSEILWLEIYFRRIKQFFVFQLFIHKAWTFLVHIVILFQTVCHFMHSALDWWINCFLDSMFIVGEKKLHEEAFAPHRAFQEQIQSSLII